MSIETPVWQWRNSTDDSWRDCLRNWKPTLHSAKMYRMITLTLKRPQQTITQFGKHWAKMWEFHCQLPPTSVMAEQKVSYQNPPTILFSFQYGSLTGTAQKITTHKKTPQRSKKCKVQIRIHWRPQNVSVYSHTWQFHHRVYYHKPDGHVATGQQNLTGPLSCTESIADQTLFESCMTAQLSF